MLKGNSKSELYPIIGKLLYSIAIFDKKVEMDQVEQLKKNVRQFWLSEDELDNNVEVDMIDQIEIVFDYLHRQGKESQIYFDEFVDYYRGHSNKFTRKIKQLILKTAHCIARSTAVKNKSKQTLLAKLWILLD
tara:strand:+ start:464 stop:862 length:399 start_codon:yes stop_codon:yes gene_type:complete